MKVLTAAANNKPTNNQTNKSSNNLVKAYLTLETNFPHSDILFDEQAPEQQEEVSCAIAAGSAVVETR